MGGIGSGRRSRWDAKDSTDDYRTIDVRRWKRDGLLTPHQSFRWKWSQYGEVVAAIQVHTEPDRVTLTYRHRSRGEDWKDESYPVYLRWTACNLGGQRPWFLCPARGCGRRVAILYGGEIFACRHCYQLAYPSQREPYDDRAARRAERIRDKLGWEPGIFDIDGYKPTGMHWKTYERLTAKHDALVQVALSGAPARLQMLQNLLLHR